MADSESIPKPSSNSKSHEAFGRYTLIESLGAGGMAQVYKAITSTGRVFTLKKILKDFSQNQEFIRMFTQEAKISISLNHANVVRVLDFGNFEGSYYLAMEYIFGKDLGSILKTCVEKRMLVPIDIACWIIAECCQGLAYAHSQSDPFGKDMGIIHRDISPPNILVGFNGEAKILDFGIAKASRAGSKNSTRSGVLKGKFSYMSPEQASGKPLTTQSDIFSLGIVCYELLTSRALFYSDDELETLERVRSAKAPPPSSRRPELKSELDQIVMKALSAKLKNRYQSCDEFGLALRRFLKTHYPRTDRRSAAKFLRNLFATDFQKKVSQMRKDKEEWKDILIDGLSDDEILLDRKLSATTGSKRIQQDLTFSQKIFYDPKTARRLKGWGMILGGLAFVLGLAFVALETNMIKNLGEPAPQENPQAAVDDSKEPSRVGSFGDIIDQAQIQYDQREFDRALSFIDRALAVNPYELRARMIQNYILLGSGQGTKACAWFRSQKDLPAADELFALALCHEADGDMQEAVRLYTRFLENFPSDMRVVKVKEILLTIRRRVER